MNLRLRSSLLALALLLAPVAAWAHALNMTRVMVTSPVPGTMTVQVDIDLSLMLGSYEAYRDLLLAKGPAQEKPLRELGRRTLGELGVKLDNQPLVTDPKDWTLPDAPPDRIGDQTTSAMTTFRYVQTLAPGDHELTVTPPAMSKIEFPLAYTFSIPAQKLLMTRWLELPGASSRTLKLPGAAPVELVAKATTELSPETGGAANVAPKTDVRPAADGPIADRPHSPPAAPATSSANSAADYTPFELGVARFVSTTLQHLRLGFKHIFPQGLDHVLFVLGLFFLGAKWRPLLSQTTAFTIAHTTTLGLSSYGIITLPARIVEPLIALSIAYVAIENIVRPKLGPARLVIVFCFGLIHGLGFASSLSEVPLPRDQFFTALLAFNFGVDFGQLFVIALAFLCVGWFRNKPWYRQRIVVPGCAIIAAIGLYWTVTRIFF